MISPATVSSRSRSARIIEVVNETADSCSIVLQFPDSAASYAPGQFLTVRIPSEQTGSVARCYSLSSSPHWDKDLTIAVKRTKDGYGSNWLCDNAAVGLTLEVLPPAGKFTPHSLDENLLLFAGGSGITPVISILKSALSQGTGKIVLIYANRNAESVIFASTLSEMSASHPDRLTVIHWIETLQGIPSQLQLTMLAQPYLSYEAFICGPGPFMHAVADGLRTSGMQDDRIHLEIFSSLAGDPFAEIAGLSHEDSDNATAKVHVELEGEAYDLQWPADRTLVDVMLANGIEAPYSCREGECGACICFVKGGSIRMLRSEALDPKDIEEGYALGCQALPVSDEVTIVF